MEEIVTVLTTSDPGLVAVAKSILDGAGIIYLAKGEDLQSLFGIGSLGFNPIARAVEIQVRKEDEEAARTLLNDFQEIK